MVIGEHSYGYDQQRSNIPTSITNVDFHDEDFFRRLRQQK